MGVGGGDMILPVGIMDNLRFCSNAKAHFAYLYELDRPRFRGLGGAHTEAFIEHAILSLLTQCMTRPDLGKGKVSLRCERTTRGGIA